ncbi:hypothetical protein V7114_06970 [Neobacillus niacini]|uniref:hypothetical protein n=1 Tax=Neobacillus niacini TaxID=86668 RepID=UPI002FFEAE45
MNKPQFTFGDIVIVAGYHPQVFIVDGYREENYHYPNETWTDLVFELHCARSGVWLEADEEDLTFVAPAEEADRYLAENPPHEPMHMETSDVISWMFGGEEMNFGRKPEQPRKPTAREISAKEAEERKAARKACADEIDNLLEMAQWYRKMLEKTSDESYGDRLFAVEAELKKLVEK